MAGSKINENNTEWLSYHLMFIPVGAGIGSAYGVIMSCFYLDWLTHAARDCMSCLIQVEDRADSIIKTGCFIGAAIGTLWGYGVYKHERAEEQKEKERDEELRRGHYL